MLILSRKPGERILISDEIVVVVKQIKGDRVTFGIQAPDSVRVLRAELIDWRAHQTGAIRNG